mgnify:CR=1 FL=1
MILNGNNSECESGLSAAVRFTSNNEYTFEAFSVIFQTEELDGGGLFEVRLHEDELSSPGEVMGSWELTLDENIAREYYVFTGDTDCITLLPFTSYWLSVHPINNTDEALWLFSEDNFTYSTSNNMGDTWSESNLDIVGCTKIFGEQIYEINYEKLVSNKEEEIKKMIKFCDLDWDPICLNHHKNKKTPIKTVSISQAREPVYKSSVNSNSNYESHLSKMFDLL